MFPFKGVHTNEEKLKEEGEAYPEQHYSKKSTVSQTVTLIMNAEPQKRTKKSNRRGRIYDSELVQTKDYDETTTSEVPPPSASYFHQNLPHHIKLLETVSRPETLVLDFPPSIKTKARVNMFKQPRATLLEKHQRPQEEPH